MKNLPFIRYRHAFLLLRAIVGLIFVTHGVKRIQVGTVGGFGGFLGEAGFPLPNALAWGITILEIAGGLALVFGLLVAATGIWFIVHQMMGIILVHWKNGWFVVGPSEGGMEYSVLLIAALIAIVSARVDKTQVSAPETSQ